MVPLARDARRIADYYDAFMDEAAIEKLGLKPLEPTLREIAAVQTRDDLSRLLGIQLRADIDLINATDIYTDNLFGLWIAQDFDTPTKYAAYLVQGGLGMPDRDYYLSESESMAGIRAKYLPHLGKVLTLAKIADADAKAAQDLRPGEAHRHGPWPASRDLRCGKGQQPLAARGFRSQGARRQLAGLLQGGRARQADRVRRLAAGGNYRAVGAGRKPAAGLVEGLPGLARDRARLDLSAGGIRGGRFEFYSKTLTGTLQNRDRWKRGIAVTNIALGDAVGKQYAARYFPPAEKARAEAMVRDLIAAFSLRIDRLDWMAPETKVKAKAKLAVLKVGVGYPDKWLDYSGLTFAATMRLETRSARRFSAPDGTWQSWANQWIVPNG